MFTHSEQSTVRVYSLASIEVYVVSNLVTERKTPYSVYLSESLLAKLDESKGPFSRSRLVTLILENAVRNGIDLPSLVRGRGS